jgi:hypothetical protein
MTSKHVRPGRKRSSWQRAEGMQQPVMYSRPRAWAVRPVFDFTPGPISMSQSNARVTKDPSRGMALERTALGCLWENRPRTCSHGMKTRAHWCATIHDTRVSGHMQYSSVAFTSGCLMLSAGSKQDYQLNYSPQEVGQLVRPCLSSLADV